MSKIRGVLAQAFESVICLRGFASLEELALCSRVDSKYQRALDEGHSDALKKFLMGGQFAFFPEIILGMSIEDMDGTPEDFELIKAAAKDGTGFSLREVGKYGVKISTYVKAARRQRNGREGDIEESMLRIDDDYVTMTIAGLPTEVENRCLYRIDGNHRLSVAEKMAAEECNHLGIGNVPFCIVIFEKTLTREQHGAVYFHNINFNHLPVEEEHLLKLIVDNEGMFPDELIRENPSLGPAYFLSRKFINEFSSLFHRLEFAFPKVKEEAYSMVFHSFKFLMSHKCQLVWEEDTLVSDGTIVGKGELADRSIVVWPTDVDAVVKDFAKNMEEVLKEALSLSGTLLDLGSGLLIALIYYSYLGKTKLKRFISWVALNRVDLGREAVRAKQLIDLHEAYQVSRNRTIFVSMQFGKDETENHYKVINRIVSEINRECKVYPKFEVRRVDYMVDGTSYEINHKISEEISACGLLIADLTYVNPNVYHEIGLSMGRAIAEGRGPGDNLLMILDESVNEEDKKVKFNLQSYKQIRFKQSEDLAKRLKAEICAHFCLSPVEC